MEIKLPCICYFAWTLTLLEFWIIAINFWPKFFNIRVGNPGLVNVTEKSYCDLAIFTSFFFWYLDFLMRRHISSHAVMFWLRLGCWDRRYLTSHTRPGFPTPYDVVFFSAKWFEVKDSCSFCWYWWIVDHYCSFIS
jgi:hypothetical protein